MVGAYFDNIRHILESIHTNPLVITDPIGYENSNEEFTRTFDNIGIIANFSADLKFIGNGKDYIENILHNYGLNETITIRREERDKDTDEWFDVYSSTLDLSTFSIENGEVSVKINTGGFDKIFKSRESEKLEVENTKSVDGVELPSLETKEITISGREIFLKTQYDILGTDNSAKLLSETAAGNKRGMTITVPLNVFSKSHNHAQSPNPNTSFEDNDADNSDDRTAPGVTGVMFFANSDVSRVLNISLVMSYKFNLTQNEHIDWANFRLRIAKYGNGVDFNFINAINLHFIGHDDFEENNGNTLYAVFNGPISIEPGESLSLQFSQIAEFDNDDTTTHLEINCTDIVANMIITEDSTFHPTQNQTLLLHDLGERLTALITGKQNKFKSSVLGRTEKGYSSNGKWAFLGTYSGMWLRGFNISDYNPEDPENRYKKYTTSFKDFKETIKSVLNLHVGFQSNGFEDKIVVEGITYFFNPNISLVLPTPLTNVKKYIAEDFIFSGITSGYEKGDTVEGIMGLDEPNGKANWLSNITVLKNQYELLSKYIAGVYAEEKQRRFQKVDHPTEDTDHDKDIFLKDLILDGTDLRERVWQDDYQTAPTGIYSPGTAKNIRLSPAQNLLRHGQILSTPLEHYQDKTLSFGSSTSNSMMTNYLPGGISIAENENFINSKLGNRLFEPFYIEGNHLVDSEIMKKLKAVSVFDGLEVPNFYCKVQFTLEDDPTTPIYGYLMSVKPGGEGQWKFIEASNISK